MEDIRTTADAELRKELTSHVDESGLKAVFQERYGRGWQRKLGVVLDVPETTVNGWFKSGKFPVLAKLAFGVLLSQAGRSDRKWVVVKGRDGYAVCDTQEAVGRIVADNIPSIDDALLMAAAPMLQEFCVDAQVIFDDARDLSFAEGWGELADRGAAALGASARGRTAEENRDPQET